MRKYFASFLLFQSIFEKAFYKMYVTLCRRISQD